MPDTFITADSAAQFLLSQTPLRPKIGLVLGSSVLVQQFHSFKTTTVFDLLSNYVVFASSIFYMLAVIGVLILRRKLPSAPRPYRTLGYPFVPVIYAAFYVWFLFEVYRGEPAQANIGLGLIALGAPVYICWQRFAPRPA